MESLLEMAMNPLREQWNAKWKPWFDKEINAEETKIVDERKPTKIALLRNMRLFFDNLLMGKNENVHYEICDELDMKTILVLVKNNKVEEANEAVAYNVKKEDRTFVYISFSKDREVLPDEKNRHIVIEAKTLDADVEALFFESELVILK